MLLSEFDWKLMIDSSDNEPKSFMFAEVNFDSSKDYVDGYYIYQSEKDDQMTSDLYFCDHDGNMDHITSGFRVQQLLVAAEEDWAKKNNK